MRDGRALSKNGHMLIIDGSTNEGGGQILRTSLALSSLTGSSFRLVRIRANRKPPGLKPQHLAAIHLAAKTCRAEVAGDFPGSSEITFIPGQLTPGKYHVEVGTAGSVTLVLQTVAVPLGLQNKSSQLTILGGTHVPASPSYHFLEYIWSPMLAQLGFRMRLELRQAGFYPAGGGEIRALISTPKNLNPVNLMERGNLVRIRGVAAVSNLDQNIATRMKHRALSKLEIILRDTKISTQELPSPNPGAFLFLMAEFENSRFGYSSLGAKGKRAEIVADEAVDKLLLTIDQEGAIDQHLADQILLPLACLKQPSKFTTVKITTHLQTNATIIEQFLPVTIKIYKMVGESGLIELVPK